jgi:hypothetical protein
MWESLVGEIIGGKVYDNRKLGRSVSGDCYRGVTGAFPIREDCGKKALPAAERSL